MASLLGIGIVSAATLLLELALLRLFAVQQFYHFAFMAISLALLGAGASGSILSVWERCLQSYQLCLFFSLTSVAAYLVINYLPFDSYSIAWDGRQVFFLALYFLAVAVPFLFSGLLVGGELIAAGKGNSSGSNQVYAANLIGSAIGSLASLPALAAFGGEGTVVLAAVLGTSATLLYPIKLKRKFVLTGLLMIGLLILIWQPSWLAQRLSPYKTLSVLKQALNADHVLTFSDATARVDVIESSTIHVLPGLSLQSPVSVPQQSGLLLDGDGLMPISMLSPDSYQAGILAEQTPNGLGYRLRPSGSVLVVESGTGIDVLFALASGASQVTAVEDNKLIIEILRGPYSQYTDGLYWDESVRVVGQSGRVFARRSCLTQYDLVILALTDPYRPVTSGAYSLTENYIYTVEAIKDYMNCLADDGLLLVTRWLQTPPSEAARTFAMMTTAMTESGRHAPDHLVAFRSLRTMTIMASSKPVTEAEVANIRLFLNQRGFDGVYYPGLGREELNRHNILPGPIYHDLFVRILDDREATFNEYRFDIRPPTDDHPFFFHFFKWQQTPEIVAGLGRAWQPFGGSGFFVLVALLLLVGLASTLFIVGPLLLRAKALVHVDQPVRRWRFRIFVYFAALGLAFLFIEIPLAQRFILVLGQPVTALAVVLFTLLLSSGVGSLTVQGWRLDRGLALLTLVTALYPLFLEPFLPSLLRLPEWQRLIVSSITLFPLGYLMGLPFASGLRKVELATPGLTPWCWAINGSFSVISAVLATIVALTWGLSVVLWLGAIAYGIAFIAFSRLDNLRSRPFDSN